MNSEEGDWKATLETVIPQRKVVEEGDAGEPKKVVVLGKRPRQDEDKGAAASAALDEEEESKSE